MQRLVVTLLLLANVLFFAWTRGWLAPVAEAPVHGEREPARLAAQVRPELINVLTPKAVNAATAANATLAAARAVSAAAGEAEACVEAGPLSEVAFNQAESALEGAGVARMQWQRREVGGGLRWAVYMGRFADTEVMRGKLEELQRLRVDAQVITAPAELAPGLVLSRHASSEAAEATLVQLRDQGVRTARVVALPAQAAQLWLRIDRADAALRDQLRGVALPGAGFTPCR